MRAVAHTVDGVSVLLAGAIFGFFYAWVCSTMWGLDAADPRVAISAMQAMNGAVRNAVFFPAFFLTPLALAVAAMLFWIDARSNSAAWFGAGALIYLVGGLILSMTINVPMNEALATVPVPAERDAAQVIWTAYSTDWQFWNQVRTLVSGIALACTVVGLLRLADPAMR